MLTTDQIRNRTKTVTRRRGWWSLEPGDLIWACEKCQGIKKGEKVQKIALLRVVSVSRVPLDLITDEEVAKEGFPNMSPDEFINMFVDAMGCSPYAEVNRIEFEYVEPTP